MNIAENRWFSVDERMPTMVSKGLYEEDGSEYFESDYVLVWDEHNVDVAQVVTDRAGQYWLDRHGGVIKAVSWMPLPTPPASLRESTGV